ncbi:MAG TPA: MFS transporter, partial [Acidobacteriaceae bacterium]|nr:MFS transporter [Acidobacteriaceae bacterium]
FVFAGVASARTAFAMEKFGGGGMHWGLPGAILGVSVLSGILAVLAARRKPRTSFVDLESLRIPTYALSIYGASAFRIAVSVLPFLLPLMFQIVFGLSAFRSGLYLLALFAGDFSMKAIIIPVLRRFGFRRILIVNGVVVAASMVLCCIINPATPPVIIFAILFGHGACRSMQFTCMTTLSYSEITPEKMSRANGFLSAVMQLSLGLGIAVGAITLRLVAHAHGHSAALPELRDFHQAILLMSVLALGPAINSIPLPPDAGATTSGHRQPQLEVNPA